VQKIVIRSVFAQYQITRSVVSTVPINVMNYSFFGKWETKCFLREQSVFWHPFFVARPLLYVALCCELSAAFPSWIIGATEGFAPTNRRTKSRLSLLRQELFTAMSAVQGYP
jgi:hypothetical protein